MTRGRGKPIRWVKVLEGPPELVDRELMAIEYGGARPELVPGTHITLPDHVTQQFHTFEVIDASEGGETATARWIRAVGPIPSGLGPATPTF